MKTLGQIAFEAYSPELAQHAHWEDVEKDKTAKRWEAAAQAVRNAVIEECAQELQGGAAILEFGSESRMMLACADAIRSLKK